MLNRRFRTQVLVLLLFTMIFYFVGILYPRKKNPAVSAAMVAENYNRDDRVRLNSIGFLPGQQKKATIAANCSTFQVVKKGDERVVYTGTVVSMHDSDSSETVYIADFSSVDEAGTYYLGVPGVGKSIDFKISSDVYDEPFKVAMLGMYLWRCGMEVQGTHNGITYSHRACHTNDASLLYITGQNTKKEGGGGWHDAGDFNKYVVNAGITVGSMLQAWEQFQDQLETIQLDIPERSNSMPDYLNEIKYELDWLLTMQYPDGSGKVAHKLSARRFCGFIMPEDDHDERFFTPWGSAATADFVAMTAMASRIYRPYDPEFADRCINAAKLSYQFLKDNPSNHKPDQSGFSTGEYDTTDADDRLWAAAEMWETLGDEEYLRDFETRATRLTRKIETDFDWGNVSNLGMFTYILSNRTGKDATLVTTIERALISAADIITTVSNNHGYGRTLGAQYYWGCNGTVVRQTMVLHAANKISPNIDYVNASLDSLGHVFGRNYYNRSYVTGIGINPPMNPHDRRSGADGIREPWPGYLVGGGWPGAKDWIDDEESYETNEVAINWNGALIYALAAFTNMTENPFEQGNDFICGDINADGHVDSLDLVLLKKYILKEISSLPNTEESADLNADGIINSLDLTLMKRYILGNIQRLPAV
ncbi:MAG: endoglucanase [Clostridium sp.]|nr:endoglucanase [Clostridium sp.]